MRFLKILKKKKIDLNDDQKRWDKMWLLWSEGQADSPYAELMTYQGEINNGGHYQYFTNIGNTGDVQKEIAALTTILPKKLNNNLQKAYEAYLVLEEKEDKKSENTIDQCDHLFYENEEQINKLLEEYAAKIEL